MAGRRRFRSVIVVEIRYRALARETRRNKKQTCGQVFNISTCSVVPTYFTVFIIATYAAYSSSYHCYSSAPAIRPPGNSSLV